MAAPPTPQTLSQALLHTEQERAEHRVAFARLAVFGVGTLIVSGFSLLATGDDVALQHRAIVMLLAGTAWSALWLYTRRRGRFRALHAYASSSVDLGFALALTVNWSVFPEGVLPCANS